MTKSLTDANVEANRQLQDTAAVVGYECFLCKFPGVVPGVVQDGHRLHNVASEKKINSIKDGFRFQ